MARFGCPAVLRSRTLKGWHVPVQVLAWLWLAQDESLGEVTTESYQRLPSGGRLDTLGHDTQAQGMTQLDSGPHYCLALLRVFRPQRVDPGGGRP